MPVTMRNRAISTLLLLGAVLVTTQATRANGQQPYGSQQLTHQPYQYDMAARSAPYAGHVNAAHHAPTFRWGWFGAEHFYPTVKWHRGYTGDHYRWSRQRRY